MVYYGTYVKYFTFFLHSNFIKLKKKIYLQFWFVTFPKFGIFLNNFQLHMFKDKQLVPTIWPVKELLRRQYTTPQPGSLNLSHMLDSKESKKKKVQIKKNINNMDTGG